MNELKISNNLLFLEARWFNTVGFILCQDTLTREYKCYTHKLGGDYNEKYTQEQDINKILAHGSYFPLEAATHLFQQDLSEDWIQEHPEYFL